MERSRKLTLAKETLTVLSSDELRGVVGGTELCNPCIVTWSCDDIKTLQCPQTLKTC